MGEVNSQEEGLESILSFSMYCGTHRNDAGFWEQVYNFNGSGPESRTYGPGSEGCQNLFPDEHPSLDEGKRCIVKEKKQVENRGRYGFFLVNNQGCLWGDYDKEQRL